MFLNASVPHFQSFLRREFLYDMERGKGEFVPCLVFGVASIPARALGFHVLTEEGAQIARLPISALAAFRGAEFVSHEELELWDCFSYEVAVTEYEILRGLRCRAFLRSRKMVWGEYMFTVDWCGSRYSEDPGESGHKCAHVLRLDNGCYAALPNNRIFWHEPSFVTRPFVKRPDYKTNTHVWRCESAGVAWHSEDSDLMFYDVVGANDVKAPRRVRRERS
jgi:hypothetical protein